jgi:hypothetical protein
VALSVKAAEAHACPDSHFLIGAESRSRSHFESACYPLLSSSWSRAWTDEVDRAIGALKPDSWKGYTIGDPVFPSKLGSYWRLDDQKLLYSFYEAQRGGHSPPGCATLLSPLEEWIRGHDS